MRRTATVVLATALVAGTAPAAWTQDAPIEDRLLVWACRFGAEHEVLAAVLLLPSGEERALGWVEGATVEIEDAMYSFTQDGDVVTIDFDGTMTFPAEDGSLTTGSCMEVTEFFHAIRRDLDDAERG